ncbi:MAG: cell division protein SepF [Clostridia bacterium]|nr:cell division protein SepF [Clostridia bacterium]MBR0414193.1 cell division protein SepF [Clostridia bacterium]
MSFIDKIKDLVNVPDDDYEEDAYIEEDYEEEELKKPKSTFRSAPEREKKSSTSDYGKFSETYAEPSRSVRSESERNDKQNKVVNIHTTTQVQVVLAHPEKFEGVTKIADHLNNKRTVVLNLEATQRDVARRIVDFLYGAAYANGGEIRRVAASTFIIIPHNVNIVGDLIDELENNGVFFSE